MSTTFIAAFKDKGAAETEVGFRETRGFKVALVGPTDRVQLDGDSPTSIIWDSGTEQDWFLVIATKDSHTPWSS